MPELIVITFDTESGADEARTSLRDLPPDQTMLIQDAMTATAGDADALGFGEMRRQPSRLISLPRALAAATFDSALKATAWALVIAGTVGSTVIRGVQRIDGKSVAEIEGKLDGAKSTLFLITDGSMPVELVESLSDQDVDVMHATISSDNAAVLRKHLQPE